MNKFLYERGTDEFLGWSWVVLLFVLLMGIRALIVNGSIIIIVILIPVFILFFLIEKLYPPRKYVIFIDESGKKSKVFIKKQEGVQE